MEMTMTILPAPEPEYRTDKLYGKESIKASDLGFSDSLTGQISYLSQRVEREHREPRKLSKPRLRLVEGFTKEVDESNERRIHKYLLREAVYYLNTQFHEKKIMPSVDDVHSHVFTVATAKVPDAEGGVRFFSRMEQHSRRVAEFVYREFDPDYFENQARRGAVGGAKSKRRPTYSRADYLKTQGMTEEHAALFLGCSERTVRRMRAKHRPVERDTSQFNHLLDG